MKLDRRAALAGLAGGVAFLGAGACTTSAGTPSPGFVRREGPRLLLGSAPYRVAGANMWYAAWLGADAPFGDRGRLGRELDRLKALGLNNLRIMAAAEEGPLKNSIKPGFSKPDGSLDAALLGGLDFALAEIARRGMTAVVCLGNFWEWSGGFGTWLYRVTGAYMDMNDPAHPWPAYPDATSAFYANADAVALYRAHVRAIVGRTNSVTGQRYIDDRAIMAWQLANEPRPGGSDAVVERSRDAYFDLIDGTAGLIRSLDGNHLVSLGHEGTQGANGSEDIVRRAHAKIDYLTAHIWPLNWGWVSGKDLPGTWDAGSARVHDYLVAHERLANELGKPLLFEEFGFPRDGESYAPDATTEFRDRYYRLIYDAVERSWENGGPIMGSNFWAWNGEARAAHADFRFAQGDRRYMGDPPHEPQGWVRPVRPRQQHVGDRARACRKTLSGSCGAMRDRLTHTTRREALAGLAALSLAGCGGNSGSPPVASRPTPAPAPVPTPSPVPPPSPSPSPSPSLNTLAAQKGRRWGSAIAWNAGADGGSIQNPDYAAIIRAECGVVVPENELKWQRTRPGPETFDFTRMDQIAAWAQGAGLAIRGHTLLWHRPRWFPAWLNTYDYGANPVQEAERLLTTHIRTVTDRYRGVITSYDVVNEAIDHDSNGLIETSLSRAMGGAEAVLDLAFQSARAQLPTAELVYNDYMSWEPQHAAHCADVLRLLEGFRRRNVPVDALGIQSHIEMFSLDPATGVGPYREREWRQFLDEVVAMGYRLLITEFDVKDKVLPADIAARDAKVADYARRYFDVMLDYRELGDILAWGMVDKFSWLQGFAPRDDGLEVRCCPYDSTYRPKPLRTAIAESLAAA